MGKMGKKSKIFIITMLMSLVGTGIAFASANNISQIDVNKTSNDTVNLTLYSSNPSGSNVMVRKKSDNKYVILIPNSSSSIATPNFRDAKDVVNDIDIKTVNDTGDGYTKVTLITKKPVNIKARAVKTTPVTPEQQEYRELLKEANFQKPNPLKITSSKPLINSSTKMVAPPKLTHLNHSKVSNNSDNFKNLEIIPISLSSKTKNVFDHFKPNNNNNTVKAPSTNKTNAVKVTKNNTNNIQNPINNTKSNNNISTTSNVKNPVTTLPNKVQTTQNSNPKKLVNINFNNVANNIPKPLTYGFIVFAALLLLSKYIMSVSESAKNYQVKYTPSLDEALSEPQLNKKSEIYSEITENENLNWKDKYKKFNEAVKNPIANEGKETSTNKVGYVFINKDNISKKRERLEDMFNPSDNNINGVQSEDDYINSDMENLKFKGFADNLDLETSNRNRIQGIKTTKSTVRAKKSKEQENVKLGKSKLHRNLRKFNNGALNVFDVKKKSKSIKELKKEEDSQNQDYLISTLDEFFSVEPEPMAKEEVTPKVIAPKIVNSKNDIIDNLNKINSTIKMPRLKPTGIDLSKAFATNPLNSKPSFDNGKLTVVSNYNIDDNHSFYVVNLDNRSAIIGKSGDEISIIKQFDKIINKPLQVRRDKDNVYMVRMDTFKSLVEVKDNKIGVLIEL